MAIESAIGLIAFTFLAVVFSVYASKHRAADRRRDEKDRSQA